MSGQRDRSLESLESYLSTEPADLDARFLYGLVLSWERRFGDARRELSRVLEAAPAHADALLALANVEWWSGHFDRLDDLAREALVRGHADERWPLHRSRALVGLGRYSEAREVVDQFLRAHPGAVDAARLRDDIAVHLEPWVVSIQTSSHWFSDARPGWTTVESSIGRRTSFGQARVHLSTATRAGAADRMYEVSVSPRLRAGTAVDATVGRSDTHTLYPTTRAAVDVYQSVGRGIEASAGWRRLQFAQVTTIFVGSVTKYLGAWMVTGRVSYVPTSRVPSTGAYALAARRYFGRDGTSFVGLGVGRGFVRGDIRSAVDLAAFDARTVHGDLSWRVTHRWRVAASVGTARQDVPRGSVSQHTVAAQAGLTF